MAQYILKELFVMEDKEKTSAEMIENPAIKDDDESILEGIVMAQAAICTQVKEKARQEAAMLQKQSQKK